MTEQVLYKWFTADKRTCNQNIKWPKRKGAWTDRETPILCESGWHGTTRENLLEWMPGSPKPQLWVVETSGLIVHGDTKFAAERMRLVECVAVADERLLRLFACDVAEDVLPIFEKARPNDRRVRECIEAARRFVNGDATRAELTAAQAAAWDAAGDAAGDAAWDAAQAAAGAKYREMFAVRLGL